jgi:hypothetical protein
MSNPVKELIAIGSAALISLVLQETTIAPALLWGLGLIGGTGVGYAVLSFLRNQ